MKMLSMSDLVLKDKRVMLREDLNVPMHSGQITNMARIDRALPTIQQALAAKAKLMVLSHLGRPIEGEYDEEFSLAPIAEYMSQQLNQTVRLIRNWLEGVDIQSGEIVLAENVRFNVGEKKNDPNLAKRMAQHCDIFVMDAFATAHRAEATTVGLAEYAAVACAGPLLIEEIEAIDQAMEQPNRPVIAIVGGSKISTKIQLLEMLLDQVDYLIVGGGIANTFLAAKGHNIGKSLYEPDWLVQARSIIQKARNCGVGVPLPEDVRVAKEFDAQAEAMVRKIDEIGDDEMILDVGPDTAKTYAPLMEKAGTIIWNGPVGVFEFPHFADGTRILGEAIANSDAYSLAGGGDTLAALDQFAIADRISYISTGGGAFIAYLEGEPLPALEILQRRTG